MNIEVGGEYVTLDGRKAEVLRVGVNAGWSVLALVTEADGRQFVMGLDSEGRTTATSEPFITPAPKKHTRTLWACWREDDEYPRSFSTQQECLNYVANFPQHKWLGITGPHEITFTEGDGLAQPLTPAE